ncbi:unnamed protein product [Schistocephalus solidus]|uniref:Ski_Sno domain-containing protein n=1 Tax=Schistocephalus solidus TaxID=70667 RepID=A0A183SQX2_SCHSO|nr:unnamed protein product [Schistocephalus solidus]
MKPRGPRFSCGVRFTIVDIKQLTYRDLEHNLTSSPQTRHLPTYPVTVQTIKKDTGEDLPGDGEQRDSSVVITELPVPLPLVVKDDDRVFEIMRNLSMVPHLLEECCEFRHQSGPGYTHRQFDRRNPTMSTVCSPPRWCRDGNLR